MRWENDIREIGDQIAGLTVARAVELAEYLKVVHGIKPECAPVVLPDTIVDTRTDQPKPEPTEFAVVLESFEPAKKIGVIKAVRENTGLGLKEAKETVEAFPKIIRENLPKPEAEKLKAQLEDAGAKVSLKPVEEG